MIVLLIPMCTHRLKYSGSACQLLARWDRFRAGAPTDDDRPKKKQRAVVEEEEEEADEEEEVEEEEVEEEEEEEEEADEEEEVEEEDCIVSKVCKHHWVKDEAQHKASLEFDIMWGSTDPVTVSAVIWLMVCVFADLSRGRVGIDKFPEDSEKLQVYMDINGLGADGYVGRFVQVTFV